MNLPEDVQLRLENLSVADQCLVHRYLYYILCRPILTDHDYDRLERAATNDEDTPTDHPIWFPGSDLASSYPSHIADFALIITNPSLQ